MHIETILVGIVTGFISAFFGIGGSSIDTPLLRTFLHFPPYLALGTPLPLAIIIATSAFLVYEKKHLTNFRVVGLTLLGGVPAIIAGSFFSQFLPGKTLMLLTAIMLFIIGIDFLYKRFYDEKNLKRKPSSKKRLPSSFYMIGVSLIAGFISGLLANGGGIFFVPAYVILFKMDMKEAVATSLLTVAFMALPASLVHYFLGHVDLKSTAFIGIGAIPMAFIGAKLDLRTNSQTLKLLFGLLLISFSVYFFLNQLMT